MFRASGWIVLAGVIVMLESGCGTSAGTPPPSQTISITTPFLPDGMVTFEYNQTIRVTDGVAPFKWMISSGTLPKGLALATGSTNSVTISGTADTAQTAQFTIQVMDASGQSATQPLTIAVKSLVSAQLQEARGRAPAGTIEIQGLSAGSFNPTEWQQNTLNWVPDVRIPMLAPLPGAWQNIYSPWPLEQDNGWTLFFGGWDGTDTPNDRVYSLTTSDFLSFDNRALVIDHGQFQHVNNVNVTQLADGSMHMICTTLVDQNSNDKPAYFSSLDGVTWNGSPEPYSAQMIDVVSIQNDPLYPKYDYNGGNVLLRDNGAWTLYYSDGVYGGNAGAVYRATTAGVPPVFQSAGSSLNTQHYANDVKKFRAGAKDWYLMALYVEEAKTPVPSPTFSYSLSNDGKQFGMEQEMFGGSNTLDQYPTTPAFLTKGDQVLGVLYGGNSVDLLNAQDQIFARWLQKRVVITDESGTQYFAQGGYGPDRQRFVVPQSGSLQGTIAIYEEDGITPLAKGPLSISGGKAYRLLPVTPGS